MLQRGMLDTGNVAHMQSTIRRIVLLIASEDNVLPRCAKSVEHAPPQVHSIQHCIKTDYIKL